MRILFLSPREAWPPNSGAKLRDVHFAHGLAAESDLSYVFYGTKPAEEGLQEYLGAEQVVAVDPPDKYTAGKIIKGLFGRYPLPVQNYSSPQMARQVAAFLKASSYDLVHLDSLHLASLLPLIRKLAPYAPVVLDWHNIESEAMERFAAAGSGAKALYARHTANRLRTLENQLLQQCPCHIVCSERESSQLRGWAPKAQVAVVANGVDTEYFQPVSGPVTKRLVFVGQMSYHANADGIIGFVREVWPFLLAEEPNLQLSIVGSDPGPAVLGLANEPGVTVTGTVPDVREYYSGALAAIVPLRTGGGTRLKILEAMAAGVPVISTALGAEGLAAEPGRDFLLADDPHSWTEALKTVRDEPNRAAMAASARQLVCSDYDWDSLGRKLASLYKGWVSTGATDSATK